MTRSRATWLVALLVLGTSMTGCGRGGDHQMNINLVQAGKVVVEAEKADEMLAPMVLEDVSEASGGKCLVIVEGAGKPGGDRPDGTKYPDLWGRATYTIQVPADGEYVFWGRTWWLDSCGNSVDVAIDEAKPQVFGGDSTFKSWHWVKGPTFELKAGNHRLVVLNREDGVKLDQYLLTTDSAYRPVGTE